MAINVKCSHCDGAGNVPLARHLQETYDLLQNHGKQTPTKIHERLGERIGITAVNNRLEDLRDLNLVRRFRFCNQWVYVAGSVVKDAPIADASKAVLDSLATVLAGDPEEVASMSREQVREELKAEGVDMDAAKGELHRRLAAVGKQGDK